MRRTDNPNISCPCFGCTPENGGRHTACHDYCQRYRTYKLEMERKREYDRKYRGIDADTEYQLRKQGAVWLDKALNARSGRKQNGGI